MLESVGVRLGGGIGLRLCARGKGTVEEEDVENERAGRSSSAGVHGGVQGVVDMLHAQHQ